MGKKDKTMQEIIQETSKIPVRKSSTLESNLKQLPIPGSNMPVYKGVYIHYQINFKMTIP